jgi:hypothetical protein
MHGDDILGVLAALEQFAKAQGWTTKRLQGFSTRSNQTEGRLELTQQFSDEATANAADAAIDAAIGAATSISFLRC